jgi:hypothetical protein
MILFIIIIIINAAVVKKFSNLFELFKFTINELPIRKVLLKVVTVDIEAAAVEVMVVVVVVVRITIIIIIIIIIISPWRRALFENLTIVRPTISSPLTELEGS